MNTRNQGRIQGRGPGARRPLFLDQTEARRAEKPFFGDQPPPLYLRVWMTPLPPPPLISRCGSASGNLRVRCSNWHLDYRYCNFLFQGYFIFQLVWLESKKYSHRTRKNLKQVLGNGSKASSAILDISEIAYILTRIRVDKA